MYASYMYTYVTGVFNEIVCVCVASLFYSTNHPQLKQFMRVPCL